MCIRQTDPHDHSVNVKAQPLTHSSVSTTEAASIGNSEAEPRKFSNLLIGLVVLVCVAITVVIALAITVTCIKIKKKDNMVDLLNRLQSERSQTKSVEKLPEIYETANSSGVNTNSAMRKASQTASPTKFISTSKLQSQRSFLSSPTTSETQQQVVEGWF